MMVSILSPKGGLSSVSVDACFDRPPALMTRRAKAGLFRLFSICRLTSLKYGDNRRDGRLSPTLTSTETGGLKTIAPILIPEFPQQARHFPTHGGPK